MKARWNWAMAIAVTYTVFAVSMLGFVAFALARPVDLVSADYYADALAHDARIEAARRGAALAAFDVAVASGAGEVVVTLPLTHAGATGTVTFYRPSGSAADRTMPLSLDGRGEQRVPVGDLPRGYWTVQVEWEADGLAYYREQPLRLR